MLKVKYILENGMKSYPGFYFARHGSPTGLILSHKDDHFIYETAGLDCFS
jgi:hypothetical protein